MYTQPIEASRMAFRRNHPISDLPCLLAVPTSPPRAAPSVWTCLNVLCSEWQHGPLQRTCSPGNGRFFRYRRCHRSRPRQSWDDCGGRGQRHGQAQGRGLTCCIPVTRSTRQTWMRHDTTMAVRHWLLAYLRHGKKTNSTNPPRQDANPPGQILYSTRADCSIFRPGGLQHNPPRPVTILSVRFTSGQTSIPPRRNSYLSAWADCGIICLGGLLIYPGRSTVLWSSGMIIRPGGFCFLPRRINIPPGRISILTRQITHHSPGSITHSLDGLAISTGRNS